MDYLEKIRLLSIETTEFLEHKDLNEFSNDTLLRKAMILNLMLIGEYASNILRVDPAFVDNKPDFKLHQARGLRNIIAHEYDGTEIESLFNTAKYHVSELIPLTEKYIGILKMKIQPPDLADQEPDLEL